VPIVIRVFPQSAFARHPLLSPAAVCPRACACAPVGGPKPSGERGILVYRLTGGVRQSEKNGGASGLSALSLRAGRPVGARVHGRVERGKSLRWRPGLDFPASGRPPAGMGGALSPLPDDVRPTIRPLREIHCELYLRGAALRCGPYGFSFFWRSRWKICFLIRLPALA